MALEFGLQLKAFPSDGSTDLLRFYDDQIAGLPPEFTSLWVSDHFQFGHEPVLEGWTWQFPYPFVAQEMDPRELAKTAVQMVLYGVAGPSLRGDTGKT